MLSEVRWELGSEFHWMGLPPEPRLRFPEPANWYSLGRHALDALATEGRSRVLWVPTYFCPEIIAHWAELFDIKFYADDPSRAEPDWRSLRPQPADLVMAVNYFGIRKREPWSRWLAENPCILIEDHSHDPFSGWAAHSNADYAFASLRKTLPVPDGAILWSPNQTALPHPPPFNAIPGAALKLAAMMFKAEYLVGSAFPDLKCRFRRLQMEGERLLEQQSLSAPLPSSREYLAEGAPEEWRRIRGNNVRFLVESLRGWNIARCLFESWPQDGCPYACVLVFDSRAARDAYRALLQQHNVYCPIHWGTSSNSTSEKQISETVLSIPADQRYTVADMERITRILLSSAPS